MLLVQVLVLVAKSALCSSQNEDERNNHYRCNNQPDKQKIIGKQSLSKVSLKKRVKGRKKVKH